MKLEVFSLKEKDETVRLALEQLEDEVVLQVVNSYGDVEDRGNILIVTKDGCIKMCTDVNENLGFKLEKSGKVKIV